MEELEKKRGRWGGGGCAASSPGCFLQMVWRPWGFLVNSGKNLEGNSLAVISSSGSTGPDHCVCYAKLFSWFIPCNPEVGHCPIW